jgi:type I restriction enzyme, S subunit
MEKKNKIPQLRFPEFEGEWDENLFGELFSFKTTNSFSREQLNYDFGDVKNIHYGDVHTKFDTLFDIREEAVPMAKQPEQILEEQLIAKLQTLGVCSGAYP